MGKKLITLSLMFAIFFTSNFAAPKANALVGLLVKSKTTKIVGGIGAGAGAATVGGVFIYAATTTSATLSQAIGAILVAYLGIVVGGIGLLVLDDNTVADVEFMPIVKSKTPKFTDYDIKIYNSELEELNAVRKTIQAEVSENTPVSEVTKLWNEYKEVLRPETIAIAEAVAADFSNSLKK